MLRLITCVFFGFIAFFITNRVLAADVASYVTHHYEQQSSAAFDRLYSRQQKRQVMECSRAAY